MIDRIVNLPYRGSKLGLRRSVQELALRERLRARNVGTPPRGPSPKEMPFRKGELERLVEPFMRVCSRRPVLIFSYQAATSILLARLSYPVLGAVAMWPYLWLARFVERRILARRIRPGKRPVFELMECEVRDPVAMWPPNFDESAAHAGAVEEIS